MFVTTNVFRAGLSTTGGGFSGTIDEVRLSSSAHSADKIASDYRGLNGVAVTLVTPSIIQRGASASSFTFYGAGLTGASVTATAPDVSLAVGTTSYARLNVSMSIPADFPLGSLPLTVTDPVGQTTTVELTVVDQTPFVNDSGGSETILLWHLDEAGNGGVSIVGSGDPVLPAIVNGTAFGSSLAAPGRFGGGRKNAHVVADAASASLSFGTSSFTVECWMKSLPVTTTEILVSKSNSVGAGEAFKIELQPSGALRAVVWDNSSPSKLWETMTAVTSYPVTNDQWHHVAMVVDRTANKLSIYADGVERASSSIPSGFGSVFNTTNVLRAGLSTTGGGFTGTIDEVRIVNFARTAAQIHDTWFGTNTTGLNFRRLPRLNTMALFDSIGGATSDNSLIEWFSLPSYTSGDSHLQSQVFKSGFQPLWRLPLVTGGSHGGNSPPGMLLNNNLPELHTLSSGNVAQPAISPGIHAPRITHQPSRITHDVKPFPGGDR